MNESYKSYKILGLNTFAFAVCFACWMMYGALITWLIQENLFEWTKVQIGWLIGIPVLTGSILRLPVGLLADRFGGRKVFTGLMFVSALPLYFVSACTSYSQFFMAGLGFGISGASFAAGVAYTSVWFRKENQGTALGIFGIGNAGAALAGILTPFLLYKLTRQTTELEAWRQIPKIYAAMLVMTALGFYFLTEEKSVSITASQSLGQRLAPLKQIRVWRFGLYYFFVFGGFVALAQWLIPFYVNVYFMSVASAGLLASAFILPSSLVRALGGWMSDKLGARKVMYWVLTLCTAAFAFISFPNINVTLFTFLLAIAAVMMGFGMAAVYKYIPEYFPDEVGVVGGLVGVLGGLGGFFCPIVFSWLLKTTGLWTSCWLLLGSVSLLCLAWMHSAIREQCRNQKKEMASV